MHPEQIKAAIRMTGTTPAAIADEMNLSRTSVSSVINGYGQSRRIQAHIAKLLDQSVDALWPAKPVTVLGLRRPKTTQPLTTQEQRDHARRERERRDGDRRAGASA
jgi:lambda repressor-like predicted transcriptional regulator